MRQTTEQDERVIRYLLGDLPEAEQVAVEQEYFADPEKFEEVWAAENDLVDRYAQGRLSRGELELFERNYLRTPRRRERVAVAGKLLEAAQTLDRPAAESDIATQIAEPSPFRQGWRRRLTEMLNGPGTIGVGLAVAATLLLAGFAWLSLERARLTLELERTNAQLTERQRREREIADQLEAEREQSGKLKSELDRLRETLAQRPSQPRPSILSFLLAPASGPRSADSSQRQITISRETDLIQLQMKIEQGDSRKFQAAIRTVEGTQAWNQRSLKPRSGVLSVNVPADKLPLGDYILTLSAITHTGETEDINRYYFRVIRK